MLGYPMGRHTDQVTWDSGPVTASDLAARLKHPAMVKPPCYWAHGVEVVVMERMMLIA